MSEQTKLAIDTDLGYIFSDILRRDERPGYEGYIVKTDALVAFATALRDDIGYDYLVSVTGVDYPQDGILEVVYHVRKSTGGRPLNFKVQVPREQPVVPSLVFVYPGADFQEGRSPSKVCSILFQKARGMSSLLRSWNRPHIPGQYNGSGDSSPFHPPTTPRRCSGPCRDVR